MDAEIPPRTRRLLFKTRNSGFWAQGLQDFQTEYVGLAPDAAEYLVNRNVKLVGIDYLSVAPYRDPAPTHQILLEAENTVVTDKDVTGHAETNLIRLASAKYAAAYLENCTIYTSTEPCPMCAGAIFWSNIRRVVFGLRAERLYKLGDEDSSDVTMSLTCREVFERGLWQVEVIGPVLEDEAEKVHAGFWR